MNLIIDSRLCEPPSEIYCFRDVTLFGKVFIFEDILLKCKAGTRSIYWKWLKSHGAHDFISEFIQDHEKEYGFTMGYEKSNLNIDRINVHNLSFVISSINSLKNNERSY